MLSVIIPYFREVLFKLYSNTARALMAKRKPNALKALRVSKPSSMTIEHQTTPSNE